MKTNQVMENVGKGLITGAFLEKWHSNYRKLEAFCRQDNAGAPDEELAGWLSIQRSIRHMLPGELRGKLEALDRDVEDKGTSWDSRYGQLAAFVRENGHACLPDDHRHEVLKDWLMRQILNRRLLSPVQFQALDDLGVDWDIAVNADQRWASMLRRLLDFHLVFGHCRVPQNWARDKQLAHWVTVQRRMYAKGKISEYRQRMLQGIGFVWNMQEQYDAQWNQHFQQLEAYREAHGHCLVPGRHQKLVSWMERQRLAKAKNLLSPDREERLSRIGFVWSFDKIKSENWETMYAQLRAYRQRHGHSFVPVNCRENKPLGVWVGSQRWLEDKGKLKAARKKKLDALGFVWSHDTQKQIKSLFDTQWEAGFERLRSYREAHGTCQVSLKADPALQRWTRWQRRLFYEGRLAADRIERLNEIRFPWNVQEGYWMKMYDALADFQRQFGHTRVPSQWETNPRLAAWAYRARRDKNALTPQKKELLSALGFDWTLAGKKVEGWPAMYQRLVAFRQEHGHTRVPLRYRQDPKLGKWVSRMRHERARLAPERFALLEALGFHWGSRQAPKKPASSHKGRSFALALAN